MKNYKKLLVIVMMLLTVPIFIHWKSKATGNAEPITILKKWTMPDILKEVSGIEYISANQFACIMDEEGTVYIYNTTLNAIEKEIKFGGSGDFEGIAVAGNTIYANRSNGIIYSIADYNSSKPVVKEYATGLTVKQNVEGLCYDEQYDRLLLSIKGKEPNSKDYKGIYAFDLKTNKFDPKPVFKIDLTAPIWKDGNDKHTIRPSDLAIHPITKDIYIIDGADPKLLIMGANGSYKKLYQLSDNDFSLPEGITFTPKGDMYICNEGKLLGKGNILHVEIGK